jgi:glycerol-3-phosphate acyltransferase PlsX
MNKHNTDIVRVAVDAMGGDHAPSEVVQGAIEAAREGGVQILLVGDSKLIQAELVAREGTKLPIMPIPSEGVIEEGESPIQGLRQKPLSSIAVTIGAVKKGHADAAVSMGSTGATMAASAFAFGLMDGMERPALGGPIIGTAPNTVVLDIGSSVDCRPIQLVRYAALGIAFARSYLNIEDPRVAILSVGAEEGKGNRQAKEAYALFKQSSMHFIGNVEGNDLAMGKAEVVVCDGFIGNVIMKLSEGIGEQLAEYLSSSLTELVGSEDVARISKGIYELLNPGERTGAGPLFGVKGLVLIGHGRSRAPAIAQAIRSACYLTHAGLVKNMEDELSRVGQIG